MQSPFKTSDSLAAVSGLGFRVWPGSVLDYPGFCVELCFPGEWREQGEEARGRRRTRRRMPELPEVEAARRLVERHCIGAVISRAKVADDSTVISDVSPSKLQEALTGRRILGAHRKGKHLWLQLDAQPWPSFQFGPPFPSLPSPPSVKITVCLCGDALLSWAIKKRR